MVLCFGDSLQRETGYYSETMIEVRKKDDNRRGRRDRGENRFTQRRIRGQGAKYANSLCVFAYFAALREISLRPLRPVFLIELSWVTKFHIVA